MTPTALITGVTGGIGRAIADILAPTHHLYLLGRDAQALTQIASEYPNASIIEAELNSPEGLETLMLKIQSLDVLVHSAGVLRMGTVEEVSQENWEESFQVNALAPISLTRQLLPALRSAGGHVFMINSGLGLRTIAGSGAYSASKFAMKAFADALRLEEAAHGVKVTSIHPGRVGTQMQAQLHAWENKEYSQDAWVRPEQVATALHTALTLGDAANLDSISINPAPSKP